jgi:hypothetical protein
MLRKLVRMIVVFLVLALLLPVLTYTYVKTTCEKQFNKDLAFFAVEVVGRRLRFEFKEVGGKINIYAKDIPFGDYYQGMDIAGRRVLFDRVADNEFKDKLTEGVKELGGEKQGQ